MSTGLKELNGFRALESGRTVAWNTPFSQARDALREGGARALEERGMRTLRFLEFVGGRFEVLYELSFSADYGFGLRSASAEILEIDGKSFFKDAEGSLRPLVDAYFALLQRLKDAFGDPALLARVDPQDPDKLVHLLDHTREQATAMASWAGPRTEISHELQISFTPRHILRFSAAARRLLLVNRTHRGPVNLSVEFPGGSAQASMGQGQERAVELPLTGEITIRAELRGASAELTRSIDFERRTIEVRRGWLTGRLKLVDSDTT